MARNAKCPLCGEPDSIGHILGGCSHKEVTKVYISRHDVAARFVMKLIQKGGLGSFYRLADVGTAGALEALGASAKRLPDWLVTEETMQKLHIPPPRINKNSDQIA